MADAVAAIAEAALPAAKTTILLADAAGEKFGAHVLPLGSGLRRYAGAARGAAAAIFVRSAAIDFPAPIQTVAALYALTPAEARVMLFIIEVQGVAAVAGVLDLSQATVKTHLRNIFRKTGAANQADLVKLVAGHASPLA